MSKYTTELRYICEMKSGYSPEQLIDKSIGEIITASRPQIFNFYYPIYDEKHRKVIEEKILRHYYLREICCETYGMWQHYLNMTMNEIMPKYNKIYEMEELTAGKLIRNIDVYRDNTRTNDLLTLTKGVTENNLKSVLSGLTNTTENINRDELLKNLFSDTPQGTLSGVDTNTYLTDYRKNINEIDTDRTANMKTDNTTQDTGTINNDESVSNKGNVKDNGHEYGYRGIKQLYEILHDYLDKVVEIDDEIVYEMKDLFFKLW